jgi:hypothetical protein
LVPLDQQLTPLLQADATLGHRRWGLTMVPQKRCWPLLRLEFRPFFVAIMSKNGRYRGTTRFLRSTNFANASTKTEGVTKIAVIFAIRSRKKGDTRV